MRVLHVIDSLDASGGAERSLAALTPELVTLGVDLHVACLRERAQSVAEQIQLAGASVHSLAGHGGRTRNVVRIAQLTRTLDPDLVHTTLFEADQAGRIGARAARRPVVSSFVSDAYGPEQFATPGLPTWKLKAAEATDMLTAHLAVRFHAITSYVADVMSRRLHIPRTRIDVVPRGRDPHAFGRCTADRRSRVRSALGVGEEQPLVVAVGRQEWQKGHDILIDATSALARRWPAVTVVIAGRSGQQTDALLERIARMTLEPRVRILGFRNDIPDLLCAADAFVFPSRWEGLGSTLLEAMALEVPIVASDLPAVREVVSPAEAQLVPPADPIALADAISELLADPDATRGHAVAARDRLLAEFTIERTAKAMVAFYERRILRRGWVMTSRRPRASVVIPTYNRADVVGRALASVLAQTVEDFEVIVVDDGSTDATPTVVAAFDDERVAYLSAPHEGAAAARNVGANHARETWLTFVDSDDTVAPDWLSSLLAASDSTGTALVSCGYTERIDGTGEVLRVEMPRLASPSVGPIVELISTGGSYMLRRALFLEIGGFDPRQSAAQHQELALRLGPLLVQRSLRCAAVNRSLVERWVGRGDHIRGNDQAVFDGSVRLLDVHREQLALDRPLMANTAATAAFRAVRLGRFEDARRLMWFAARTQPRNVRHWARLAALVAPRTAQRLATRSRPATTAPVG